MFGFSLKITVLGAGNMGTAIADVIGKNGRQVKIWNYEGDQEPLNQIKKYKENKKYLTGIRLSENIIVEENLEKAVRGADVIFYALPSSVILRVFETSVKFLKKGAVCVDVSKGVEEKILSTIPSAMQKLLPEQMKKNVVSLSGPAIAVDIAKGAFTAMNVASQNEKPANLVKKILENDNMRLQYTNDFIGIEIAGSLKNVYAIALGIADCYKWPMNTKSAILVSALKEMADLIKKMGGDERSVFGLAGIGDMICTALSPVSRNRRFGECLPKFADKEKACESIGQVVEGINTCNLAMRLSKKYKIKMPLAKTIYAIVWEKHPAEESMKKFLKSI
jgi:glycerol-3-phosphate dehydrogenase (NAD(P)+)